jgi:hypothetical protein
MSLEVKKENWKESVYPSLHDYPSFLLKRAEFLNVLRNLAYTETLPMSSFYGEQLGIG